MEATGLEVAVGLEALLAAADTILDWLKTYWIVPAGMIALYYYGKYHFNTPDYALADEKANAMMPWNSDAAKLRSLTPPMFTTNRSRYNRYALRYVLIIQVAFLLITAAPDVIASAANVAELKIALSQNIQERGLWALFGLTGLLSSFPMFKDLDSWILSNLHKRAAIPHGARITAQALFEAEFSPTEEARAEVVRSLKTQHARLVAQGQERGSLEQLWLNVRCLNEVIQLNVKPPKYEKVLLRLQSDRDGIYEEVSKLRERLFDYFTEQDRLVPGKVEDLDILLENKSNDPTFRQLTLFRKSLDFDVKALYYRMCLFCAVMIYASEPRPEAMNQTFKQLGFKVSVVVVPDWDWESVLKVFCAILGTVLGPSLVYLYIIQKMVFTIPPEFVRFVPASTREIIAWAGISALMHTAALAIALKMKRGYARARVERPDFSRPENIVICAVTYGANSVFLSAFALGSTGIYADTFLWGLAPACTAYYVGRYIDLTVEMKGFSISTIGRQAGVMLFISAFISLTLIPGNIDPVTWPAIFVLFAATSIIASALVGIVVGLIFQRTYCARESARWDWKAELEGMNQRFVGDLALVKVRS